MIGEGPSKAGRNGRAQFREWRVSNGVYHAFSSGLPELANGSGIGIPVSLNELTMLYHAMGLFAFGFDSEAFSGRLRPANRTLAHELAAHSDQLPPRSSGRASVTVISAAILIGAKCSARRLPAAGARDSCSASTNGAHILQALLSRSRLHHGGVIRAAQRDRAVHAARVSRPSQEACAAWLKRSRPLKKLNVCSHSTLLATRLQRAPSAALKAPLGKISPQLKKKCCRAESKPYFHSCPISHVPVVVCQS